MITGEMKSKVDRIWDDFWSGGISNPLTVIEQITYLLFMRRLDEIQTAKELKANRTRKPVENPIFSKKNEKLRWSKFKNMDAKSMHELMIKPKDGIFDFIKNIGSKEGTAYSKFMKDATFMISKPGLLEKAVAKLDAIPMEDRDTKGDLYEYLLSKIATAGQNGQFRTPRHIIKMMVELVAPKPDDIVCDPACGTAGFLVAAAEYLSENHPNIFHDKKLKKHFENDMFYGFDFDSSMLRIGAMNLMLHGLENPNIANVDSLLEDNSHIQKKYTVVLANPPFKGSIDFDQTANNLLQVVKTKKTELLFVALMLRELKVGGRCAVIVPDGVLFGSSKAHKDLRKTLIEEQKLEAVISMPSGVFKPYAGVSTAILIFTRTDSGGTDNVWFYGMEADGYSLDDKRSPIEANDIPDLLKKWAKRNPKKDTDRKAKNFFVPKEDIVKEKYDLSINKYKEIVYEAVQYDPPSVILDSLDKLEREIQDDLKELREMVS